MYNAKLKAFNASEDHFITYKKYIINSTFPECLNFMSNIAYTSICKYIKSISLQCQEGIKVLWLTFLSL